MDSNKDLVDHLKRKDRIRTRKVEEAFRAVDRGEFTDEPYIDRPQRIAEGSTISAPHIVAEMLEILKPEGKVLEMGSGSGYVLALLDEIAEEAVGVERNSSLVKKSRKRTGLRVIHGDSPPDESFDQVMYSFATTDEKAREALEKTEASKVLAPIRNGKQELRLYRPGKVERLMDVRFVEERKGLS